MRRSLWSLGVTILALVSTRLAAQEDSRLIAAVRLAQDGRGDSARAIVNGLLSSTPTVDTLYPQVLFAAGLVASTTAERSRYFRRVSVEFATSSWADDALLGLAQAEFASGNMENTARTIEKLKADYPASPLMATGAYWAARAYFELRRVPEACRWLAQGITLVGEDVELSNQLDFYSPRCQMAADTSRADTTTAPAPGPAPTGGPHFAVQVAAVGSDAAASGTVAQLRSAGYDPRLVREGGLVKVRVGRYADRAQAATAASDIRGRFGGSPFVVEEP